MKNINDLDKELLKGDKMDTDAVREILIEMDSENVPKPDYEKIRKRLFTEKKQPVCRRKHNRLATAAVALIVVFMLSGFTVLAVRYIPVFYEWITEGNKSMIYTDRKSQFDTIDEALIYIGTELKIPAYFADNYTLKNINATDWGKFKFLTVQYEKNGELFTFFAVYDYADISDVMLIPRDVSEYANFEINGIPAIYLSQENNTHKSAVWEIDGVHYMLWGNFTEHGLADIINSIK